MVEQLAEDYANYFQQADISKELNPICLSIDDMLNRLDEFESLVSIVKADAAVATQQNIPDILGRRDEFQSLCNKIDRLERFVAVVNGNLATLEQNVCTAEEQLGVNALGLKGLLKPIFDGIAKKRSDSSTSGGNAEFQAPHYDAPEIFRTEDYFFNNLADST